ncbi:MAG TPA: secretin N-terminal domain-containing protein [Chthoniobacterales bacterium]|nr:secretin N-terminal domain-containing protein [Chthoniobacterales bacterium]
MPNRLQTFFCAGAAFVVALTAVNAQTNSPSPASAETSSDSAQKAPGTDSKTKTPSLPTASTKSDNLLLVQASTTTSPAPATTTTSTTTTATTTSPGPVEPEGVAENGGVGVREFQGDDVGAVLRLLARQAKINMVVSEAVAGTVTMRLEDVTALQAVSIIVKAKGLFMDRIENVYYIKTAAERTAEPTESDSYQFSYARAKEIAPLVAAQLSSKDAPQVDERTNTIFFRETRGNIDAVRKLLLQIDKPTKQVMIEARLVEVTANPRQAYGINWGGVFGGTTNPKTFGYGASNFPGENGTTTIESSNGKILLNDFAGAGDQNRIGDKFGDLLGNALGANQLAILTVPQMSLTMRLLNEDSDAEFLANPRVVTADNMQAKIEIIRSQPVPQMNFNEQTATAVFGGFQDKKFGNTLVVKPSVNKDNFITLAVKPEISNKIGDQPFNIPDGKGGVIFSPIIDTRSLDSNVLIRSGDTLAIGGLLQDEVTKARTKVPIMGDIPIIGYFFQEKLNARTKRNLLVFVTPTIIDQHYGTGLEDQVSGLHHTGEEYADPNGWRNNAKGAVRLVPTSNRHIAADYPKPGTPPAPARTQSETTTTTTKSVDFKTTANDRGF